MKRIACSLLSCCAAALLVVLAVPHTSEAQERKTDAQKAPRKFGALRPTESPESEPKVEISLTPSDKYRTIAGGFDVNIAVTNASKADIDTVDVVVCFPRSMVDVIGPTLMEVYPDEEPAAGPIEKLQMREPQKAAPGSEQDKGAAANREKSAFTANTCWAPGRRVAYLSIPAGRAAFYNFSVPKVRSHLSRDHVLFRRDTYLVQAFYVYSPAGAKNKQVAQIVREERALDFRPGMIAPLSGVVAGTLLIAFFIAVRREGVKITEALSNGDYRAAGGAAASFAWAAITTSITGLISGFILVIVLNQTDTQQLPVTVSINDFWGGAFLGLLSYKLGDWLDSKFFSRSKDTESKTGKTGS